MRQGRLVCLVRAVSALGCYSSEDPAPEVLCADQDGDGYGIGPACLGADCDDADAARNVQCPVTCEEGVLESGCACADDAGPLVCYEGPEGTAAVGLCSTGLRQCRQGMWSGCEGQVLPRDEICDFADDDCDGEVDEGVLTACGDCDSNCELRCLGVGCDPFVPGEGAAVDPDGALVVAEGQDTMPRQLWVTSASSGTVTRIDTRSMEATGRFRTGPTNATYPLAVAMNDDGDAFVVDSHAGQGATTLMRIQSADCPDLDGDGIVESSSSTETLEWGEDECVGWQVDLEDCDGGWGCGNGAGIALTDEGRHAWVSLSGARSLVEVDLDTGELTGQTIDASSSPGAVVADSDGNLWVATGGDFFYRFPLDDPNDGRESISPPGSSWTRGIDVGDSGSVAVVSPLSIYDPGQDGFDSLDWQAYDVAVGIDGSIWATDGARTLRRYDPDSLDYEAFSTDTAPSQIAIDLDGNVWTVDQSSGTVTVYDASGEEIATLLDDCDGGGGQWGGDGCASLGYLEGDPTGLRLRRAYGPAGRAETRYVFVATCDLTEWRDLAWEAEGGEVAFSVRGAHARDGLEPSEFVEVGSAPPETGAVDLRELAETWAFNGRFLEVRAVLRGQGTRLVRLALTLTCAGHGP